jgi:hypothetical protein
MGCHEAIHPEGSDSYMSSYAYQMTSEDAYARERIEKARDRAFAKILLLGSTKPLSHRDDHSQAWLVYAECRYTAKHFGLREAKNKYTYSSV